MPLLAQGGEAMEGLGGEADLEGGVPRHGIHGTGSTSISPATRSDKLMTPVRARQGE